MPASAFFKSAHIKHVRNKNLPTFRRKFAQSFVLFWRPDADCKGCGPAKEVFVQAAKLFADKHAKVPSWPPPPR